MAKKSPTSATSDTQSGSVRAKRAKSGKGKGKRSHSATSATSAASEPGGSTDCLDPTIVSMSCPGNIDDLCDQLKLWVAEWDKWFPCVNQRLVGTCCALVGPELAPGPRKALCDAVKGVTKQWYDWGIYVQELVNHCGNPSHVPPPPPPPFN